MDSTRIPDGEPGEAPAELMELDGQVGAPTREEISDLAYSYWVARGRQGGSPCEDWFRAEQELKKP